MASILTRAATLSDIEAMRVFIFEHGPNAWNFLPEKEVTAHLQSIASGNVHGVVAEDAGTLVGFITFHPSTHLSRYRSAAEAGTPHGYIAEAVVHRGYAGQGIGARLLKEATSTLAAQGYSEIYIERHEENPGSAGMMKKAGFVEIDTYNDPDRRSAGSRRTTVCRISSGKQ